VLFGFTSCLREILVCILSKVPVVKSDFSYDVFPSFACLALRLSYCGSGVRCFKGSGRLEFTQVSEVT